jgi:hypothetical protein
MFKYLIPAILCIPAIAVLVAIPGQQLVLSLLLGVGVGSVGWLIGAEMDYRRNR